MFKLRFKRFGGTWKIVFGALGVGLKLGVDHGGLIFRVLKEVKSGEILSGLGLTSGPQGVLQIGFKGVGNTTGFC